MPGAPYAYICLKFWFVILKKINIPADLKLLSLDELKQLCLELRDFVPENTKTKAGHISSSLAVTELAVALHYVFNAPDDILIWDVGHQAYVHKVLTGRKEVFDTNRQFKGISGFTRSSESVYDPFGAGHSSTSISAAVGFAMAARLTQNKRKHIAIIGDGAITGGMSFEALNYLGQEQLDVLIILNDNDSSIDDNVGALAQMGSYEQYCDALNIAYLGEVDGLEISGIVSALQAAAGSERPRLLRVKTKKTKDSEASNTAKANSFQEVFTNTLIEAAQHNEKIVAISPAMLSGSGLTKFKELFPSRTFDVGIAEQHAVTMAAAMAADGFIPVVHLYSTFSQRAYDQIVHDVALQNLHVIFCLDRAGLVGEDGATHHGVLDPTIMNTVPNLNIASPMGGNVLASTLKHAFENKGPWVIRYPKANCEPLDDELQDVIKARLLKSGSKKAVLSFGTIGLNVSEAVSTTSYAHYSFNLLKPLDQNCLLDIAESFPEIITVEENSGPGGFGDTVRAFFAKQGIAVLVRSLSLPDAFVEHGSNSKLREVCQLDGPSIKRFIEHS